MQLLKRILFGLPIILASVASNANARPQDQNNPNIEVLAKGPVHEGFAAGSEQSPTAGPIAPKAPPDQIEELPPDQKPEGENVVWIPGYWSWDEERKDFIWVSGFWRVTPPNRTWVPGNWRRTEAGYQWSSGFWNPIQQQQANVQVQYYQAPPATIDVGPTIPAPVETAVYVPGTWVWRGHWVWRTGNWIDFRPGYIWIAAHYQWTPGGYIFIDGYWDYPLADRGILFAPVYYRSAIYTRPSYYYTPTVWVRDDCLFRAMFVRRGWGTYYFGDYFGEPYAARGFTAWISAGNVSVGFGYSRGFYDPMYSYYRVSHRGDRDWNRGISESYVARHNNPALRPPTTLIQQNIVVNNIINNNSNTTVHNHVQAQNMTMLANIRDPKQAPQLKLVAVSDASRQDSVKVSRQIQDIGRSRASLENHIISTPAQGGVHQIQLNVPKTVALKTNTVAVAQPTQLQQVPITVSPKTITVPTPTPAAQVQPMPPKVNSTPPATVPQPTVVPKPTPVPTPTPVPNPMPLVVPKPTPAPVPQPAPVVVPKLAPVPQPAPVVVPKSAPAVVPQPAPVVVPKSAPAAVPQPAPVVVPRPAPAPVPQPAPVVVPRPAPAPVPQPIPQPMPAPRPVFVPPPAPAPAPVPRPAPAPPAAPKGVKDVDPKTGKN